MAYGECEWVWQEEGSECPQCQYLYWRGMCFAMMTVWMSEWMSLNEWMNIPSAAAASVLSPSCSVWVSLTGWMADDSTQLSFHFTSECISTKQRVRSINHSFNRSVKHGQLLPLISFSARIDSMMHTSQVDEADSGGRGAVCFFWSMHVRHRSSWWVRHVDRGEFGLCSSELQISQRRLIGECVAIDSRCVSTLSSAKDECIISMNIIATAHDKHSDISVVSLKTASKGGKNGPQLAVTFARLSARITYMHCSIQCKLYHERKEGRSLFKQAKLTGQAGS